MGALDPPDIGTLRALGPDPLTVMCGHGERAMTGATLLARAGHRELSVALGGPGDWAAAHNRSLATGR